MDEAAQLGAAGEPEGTVVIAAVQTAGRGRSGRRWEAPPGTALLASVLLRPAVPPGRLPVLSLQVGVAAVDAIARTTGLSPRLKWPNDLWLGNEVPGRKTGGILLTSRLSGARIDFVVAGIGINVTTPLAALPPGATSLSLEAGHAIGRDVLLEALLDQLNQVYAGFVAASGHPSLDAWRRRAALIGERVVVADGEHQHEGTYTGIDDDGRLVLRDDTGQVHRIVAGDLSRGPRLPAG